MFDPDGPIAGEIADLWWLMLLLGVGAYLVFTYFLGIGLFGPRREWDRSLGKGDLSRRWIVGGGVILPVILLTVVFAANIETMRDVPEEAPPGALVVNIVGRQWRYDVHYPEADISVRNELHIPVGRPVELRLTSADVIHSFWVPELAGKMDLLPDYTNSLVLVADEPGEHLTMCAEFCGLHHANMRLTVVVEPPERFDAWIADQQGRAGASP